ncbi:MAG: phosphoribosylaminoimidazolesuccinocarboxamide synthase [Legionellales bacterium]|nr:phosphoribosylaminoimidazolesuccinocarboxamide synthase [Legionellales bacterium]
MNKTTELYSGKAKTVYETDSPDHLILEFRDDATAFDGTKKASLARKGAVNNQFNAFIMTQLQTAGINTHFVEQRSANESVVKRLAMIPVECVVRNIAAGSICKRLGLEEGQTFAEPIFEFFYKDDALHDPMINDAHILAFQWATADEIEQMKQLTLAVNNILKPLFAEAGILLVDYKLEFGRFHGELVLGDEFTPDGCRLWDADSGEKLDKDRFRRDLGNVIEAYEDVANRLGITLT